MRNKPLAQLYAEHGGKVSDKWALYLTEIDRIFHDYRAKPIRLLEIGIQNGGSLEIWSKYFPHAQKLVGCDINPDCARLSYEDPRIAVVVGDANSDTAQAKVLGYAPALDVIMDDGSHHSSDIVKSFARYFPHLADGGVFVAEDLHCSYWREFEGGLFDPFSSITFFKRLADVISHEHWGIDKNRTDILSGLFSKYGAYIHEEALQHVHSVEFINSMCVIRKDKPVRNRLGKRVIVGSVGTVVPGDVLRSSLQKIPDQTGNVWTARSMPPDEELLLRIKELTDRDGQIASLNQTVAELRSSTSWRITAPLRALRHVLIWARAHWDAKRPLVPRIFRNQDLKLGSLPVSPHEPREAAVYRPSTISPKSDVARSHVADYSEWRTLHSQSRRLRWQLVKGKYHQGEGKSIGFTIVACVAPGICPEWVYRFAHSLDVLEYDRWRLNLIVPDDATEGVAREGTRGIASKTSVARVEYGPGCSSMLSHAFGEGDEWVIILRTLGAIEPDALGIIAQAVNDQPHASLIYADSDLLVGTRRTTPYLKPDFDLDLLRSQDYLSDLVAYRADVLHLGGQLPWLAWRLWLWDINLKVVEQADAGSVVHLHEVLFSAFSETEQPPARHRFSEDQRNAAMRVVESHLERVNERATAELSGSRVRVRYAPPCPPPLVSIIVPTRDAAGLLRQCMMRLRELTNYRPYEVIVVDNQSREPETLALFDKLRREGVRIIPYDREFNFSAINNLAAREALGNVLVFLNNDIEPISADWLDELVGLACRADVGAVGAMLYLPSETIQHAGVILGVEGVAAHAFAGLPRGADGDNGRAQCLQRYSAVTAACLAVRKLVFEEAGGFDEHNLPVAFNDVDLCLRITSLGYRNVWTPMAELYHHESASRGLDDTIRNRARFAGEVHYMKNRWSRVLLEDPAYNPNLTRSGGAFRGYRIA